MPFTDESLPCDQLVFLTCNAAVNCCVSLTNPGAPGFQLPAAKVPRLARSFIPRDTRTPILSMILLSEICLTAGGVIAIRFPSTRAGSKQKWNQGPMSRGRRGHMQEHARLAICTWVVRGSSTQLLIISLRKKTKCEGLVKAVGNLDTYLADTSRSTQVIWAIRNARYADGLANSAHTLLDNGDKQHLPNLIPHRVNRSWANNKPAISVGFPTHCLEPRAI